MTALNYAAFAIQGDPSSNRGYDVTVDGPLSLQGEASAGLIRTRTFLVYSVSDPSSPLASLSAPTLTLTGATTGTRVDATSPSAAVSLACAGGFLASGRSSWLVRCLANGGLNAQGVADPAYIFERVIAHRTSGKRALIPTEGTAYSARGMVDDIVPGTDGTSGATGYGYSGLTSSTSQNASTVSGSISMTTNVANTATAFAQGDRVRVYSAATPTDYFVADIGAFSGTSCPLTVVQGYGANTSHTDWKFALLGYVPSLPVSDLTTAAPTISSLTSNRRYRMRGLSDAGNCIVTLPAAGSITDQVTVGFYDVLGHAGSSTFRVTAGSGTTVKGGASVDITVNRDRLILTYNLSTTNWE